MRFVINMFCLFVFAFLHVCVWCLFLMTKVCCGITSYSLQMIISSSDTAEEQNKMPLPVQNLTYFNDLSEHGYGSQVKQNIN